MMLVRRYLLILAVLPLGCMPATPADSALAPAPAPSLLAPEMQGFYATCPHTYGHFEVLELRRDSFYHYLAAHGLDEASTAGLHLLRGDTIELLYDAPADRIELARLLRERGVLDEETAESLFYPARFVREKVSGHTLLWRGRRGRETWRELGEINPYAALVYKGTDWRSIFRRTACEDLPLVRR